VLASLEQLIALQELDSAAEAARRRLADLPAAERELDTRIAAAEARVAVVDRQLEDNAARRRELEKEVAEHDRRLAKFEDHKAAVKTNQEFTALLHEIEVARGKKDAIEDQIIGLLEQADEIGAERTAAEGELGRVRSDAGTERQAIAAQRAALEAELARLGSLRDARAATLDPALRTRYEHLLKQRRMVAVAALDGDVCSACNVRQRPVVTQHVRSNEEIVVCDNCQRILYARPKAAAETEEGTPDRS
jgi:predicted  nucleic acid-binding Zn-ribbon protein